MTKLRLFFRKSFLGGVLVVAPIVILAAVFNWLFEAVFNSINPLSTPLVERTGLPPLLIDFLVLAFILGGCFVIGTIVSTRLGAAFQKFVDEHLSRFAPGYRMVRDVLQQFLSGDDNSAFSSGEVALVRLYGESEVLATAMVSSRHDNGWFTVFVPTGPNPTSGFVYHLPPDCVEIRADIKLDEAFRTVIACGAGSSDLLKLK